MIEQVVQELAKLREQVNALQDKKLDSRNSSKPPSSDEPCSGGNGAQRRASGRVRGAQPGHKGMYRKLLEESEVDVIHDCPPPALASRPLKPNRPRCTRGLLTRSPPRMRAMRRSTTSCWC